MFLAAQWLRLHAPEAVGAGLIPDWGTMVLHADTAKKEKKKKSLTIYNSAPKDFHLCFPLLQPG